MRVYRIMRFLSYKGVKFVEEISKRPWENINLYFQILMKMSLT